jgi:hypothetical protein
MATICSRISIRFLLKYFFSQHHTSTIPIPRPIILRQRKQLFRTRSCNANDNSQKTTQERTKFRKTSAGKNVARTIRLTPRKQKKFAFFVTTLLYAVKEAVEIPVFSPLSGFCL